MNVWGYIKFLWLEEIYSAMTLIYLFQLNILNKKLLTIHSVGSFFM